MSNVLYYGDNLDVLREHVRDESVDLIYLDPPFNSNATHNVLFRSHAGDESRAQIQAFDDTWRWGPQADEEYEELTRGRAPVGVARFAEAMRTVLGTSDMLAYLVMMAPRLVELKRVLKDAGSIWLHCDPTASHYLKLLMDAVFGPSRFINEVVWHYHSGGVAKSHFPKKHDVLLVYGNGRAQYFDKASASAPRNVCLECGQVMEKWNNLKRNVDADGRVYRTIRSGGKTYMYYDDEPTMIPDVWLGISHLQQKDPERLGYPTQKPRALLERIIRSSCPEDGVVLDPFCGCGTAIDEAESLGRYWIGIDIAYIAVDLIIKRLMHRYGENVTSSFTVNGIPTDLEGAAALFARNPFDFERWAVSFVHGQPNERQVGDKGADGRIRFHRGGDVAGLAVVSVKGGQTVNPGMVRDLVGTMSAERAEMGVLITTRQPTLGMVGAAAGAGSYEHPPTGNRYPRVQIITIAELFAGQQPRMPTVILPYIKARPRPQSEAVSLFDDLDRDGAPEDAIFGEEDE